MSLFGQLYWRSSILIGWAGWFSLWLGTALAQVDVVGNETNGADSTKKGTVITSRSLNYDQQQRQAVFDGDVQVTDPQLQLSADRLTVFFSDSNTVQRLRAEGKVNIALRELRAAGHTAEYDVQEGKVVISGNPVVRRARDMLTGETITFWRESSRILCEPNARLVLYSEREAFAGELDPKGKK